MFDIEFINIGVDLSNMNCSHIDCNDALIFNDKVTLTYQDHTLKINDNVTFNDVYLTYYNKDQPGTIGAIFSHVDKNQFELFHNSFSQRDMFIKVGFKNSENENINLIDVDYNQFTSCS